MDNTNFVTIQGWMCNELKLKGNELLVFALINGFSQDGVSKFSGGRNYISKTFNISLPTVDKALQGLLNKDYIIKYSNNDYTHTDKYQVNQEVVKKLYVGSKETLLDGSKETLLSNINNKNIKENKTNNKLLVENLPKPKKQSLWQKCMSMIDDYTREYENSKELNDALITYLRMRLEMKDKPMYANQWKGMLNKLSKLSDDVNEQCEIVQQSINRGYLGFFEVKKYNNRSITQREGMSSKRDTHTQEERQKIRKGASDGKYERI